MNELLPDWRAQGRAARHAGGRGPLPAAHRRGAPSACRPRRRCTITATTSSASAISAAGWPAGRGAGGRDLSRLRRRRGALRRRTAGSRGVATGAHGHRQGRRSRPRISSPASSCVAKETLFAEGCRGSLDQAARRALRSARAIAGRRPTASASRSCGRSMPAQHRPGLVVHSVGWPLDAATYGGSFLYHLENRQVAVGFVVGLDYATPISARSRSSSASRRIRRSARPSPAGGASPMARARSTKAASRRSRGSIFPGGLLIGCAAGFLNVAKIKGSHTAMKSGMVAAETVFRRLAGDARRRLSRARSQPPGYGPSCTRVRNIRPGFRWGLWAGLAHAALDTYLLRGRAPWTLRHHADHLSLAQRQRGAADRLPQARRRRHLRPAILGLHLEHQSRGEPAAASAPARSGEGDIASITRFTIRPSSAIARPASTRS